MARKATIIYAPVNQLVALNKEAEELRERGATIRLVSLNEFRGETETNAGAVFVADADDTMFDAVQQAYPHLEVEEFGGFNGLDPVQSARDQNEAVGGDLRQLRMRLIGLGGSVPAGASEDDLRNLIAEQEAGLNRTPNLPNPGTQGTVIPDSTPTMAKNAADKAIDVAATGSTPANIRANLDGVDGEPKQRDGRAGQFTPPEGDLQAAGATGDEEALPRTHADLDAMAKDRGVEFDKDATVAEKQQALRAAGNNQE